MKTDEKEFFTVTEMLQRLQWKKEDLNSVIITGQLVPARFTNPGDGHMVYFDEDTDEEVDDDDFLEGRNLDWQKRQFLFLRKPQRVSATDWIFPYGCDYVDDNMTLESMHEINWIKFNKPIRLDDPEVVFLAQQVKEFEEANRKVLEKPANEAAMEISAFSRTSVLNIIGALATELHLAKHPLEQKVVQDWVIADLCAVYEGDYIGFSERTLKAVLSPALKSIQNNKKGIK
jgi:hypothetical protein